MGHRALCGVLGVVASAVVAATLGAAPAMADVTMTPGQAVQGDAAKLTFRVTEDRAPAYTTKVELLMPESAPVAETYPLSVPDWAPRMTMRKIDQTIGGIHHGQVTEVVASIVWTRSGAPAASGGGAELIVSLGPMPQTDQMTFGVVQTYSDGHVTNWNQPPSAEVPRPEFPAPVLTLAPPAAPPAQASPAGTGTDTPDDAAPVGDDSGQGLGPLAVGLAIGLLCGLAVAGWLYVRRPRVAAATGGPDPNPDTDPDTDPDPEAAPTPAPDRGKGWRLRE
ncbi:YcnI family protein [Plantactinospora sp. S1510]|uniref:YcnI family protein n=1 Tax=Plantactinospora alkalitolerans TaxID=2789879 RepID=A0ABS0GV19_9ACTN|nr:YcnI family protein [Plantactinospora alkalitolerans]MBF9129916.1 YcnI family protein [Plantactinospora alkalitolerans]